MRSNRRSVLLVLAALLTAPAVAPATTIRPPRDLGALARTSAAVVMARAGEARVVDRKLPFTVTTFELVEQVGGREVRAVFEVEVPGGSTGRRAAWIAGAPRFVAGHTYLLFLARAPRDRWQPMMLGYGILEEMTAESLLRPVPENAEIELLDAETAEPLVAYDEAALVRHLRDVVAGRARWDASKVRRPAAVATAPSLPPELAPSVIVDELHTKPPACQFQTDGGDGRPLRRFGYETGATMSIFHTTPGQTGISDGGLSAVQQGVAAWTNHPDSAMSFLYAGTRARNVSCSTSSDLDQGAVIYNDPCSDIADLVGCAGTLAFGGSFYNPGATQSYDGEPWHAITTPFVVVNNGAQCIGETGFKEMMTHELGHTQGFGHHTDPQATMAAVLKNDGRGASLAATDKACASYEYHTFLDVPYAYWAWRYIEAVENAGITTGCGAGQYCPLSPTLRQEMAIFLLRAQSGGSYNPPACTTPRFSDVPCSNTYAKWINELAARGITTGCGAGQYCPLSPVARQEMAIFILRAVSGAAYVPPACTVPMFADVPCSNSYAPWINELARRGITTGCGAGQYCPLSPVNRDEMATFLTRAFSLPAP